MYTECSEETILGFLKERGGRVKNADLVQYFRSVFPEEPPDRRAAARENFKNCVDAVAFVKSENGVKYVCLKKKFRASSRDMSGAGREKESLEIRPTCSDPVAGHADDAVAAGEPYLSRAAGSRAPGSGYGNDTRGVPHYFASEDTFPEKTEQKIKCNEFVCVVDEVDCSSGEMGNIGSFSREGRVSKKEHDGKVIDIPTIAVIEASPLPTEESVFTLPGPARTGTTGKADAGIPGLDGTGRQAETHVFSVESPNKADDLNVTRRQNSKGPQGGSVSGQAESDDREDACSLSGSEGTPKSSRKHFLELMINSSPQLRRSVALRNSVYLPSRYDSDSSSLDEDRAHVTLEPVEHEWMMCASDGQWDSLRSLLDTEPGLVLKKDFVTGFTCLHWAAKHGKPELIALIINFAKQRGVPISIDVRSSAGYTPLHIAAMHGHMDVVKLLVGAYDADVEIRDYSGKRACQYLTDNVSVDIRDIIGAYEISQSSNAEHKDGGRWRFSKVLQSNMKPIKLLNPSDFVDGEVRPREKPVRRKSSLSRMKPKLQLRFRTSQLVDSSSFGNKDELDGPKKDSLKARPKTHFFGWDR